MKTFLLLTTVLLLSSFSISCGEKARTEENNSGALVEGEVYALNDSNWVVLDYNLFDSSFADAPRNLSDGERSLAEAVIFEHIRTIEPNIYKKRKDYKRQYFCGVKDNQILIYINYFIDKSGWIKNWKSQYVIVDDGGNDFFQIKLNWTKMKCYDLSVNGDA